MQLLGDHIQGDGIVMVTRTVVCVSRQSCDRILKVGDVARQSNTHSKKVFHVSQAVAMKVKKATPYPAGVSGPEMTLV
jgi:hypothetical protein